MYLLYLLKFYTSSLSLKLYLMKYTITIFLFCFSLIFCDAQSLQFTPVFSTFSSPVDIANADDCSDRLFIVERFGTIRVIDSNGMTLTSPFLDVSTKISTSPNERGLLGMAFHPDFESNGFFYINYTDNSGDTKIARYEVSTSNPNIADASSEVILLTINQPYWNHNGGCLKFGPDGYLYIGTGDGGSSGDPECYSQNNLDLLGKMLRIDVNQNINTSPYYGIPSDNPFVGNSAYLPEIWATGLRNPWRYSFDRVTGDLWIADVGQWAWEELNFQPASSTGGEDYGWDVMEGNHCFDNIDPNCPTGTESCFSIAYTDPIWETAQDPSTGGFSITGGFVYRGCRYPNLTGLYVCADYATDNAWLIDGAGNATLYNNLSISSISTFGEDESGELYAASLGGAIYLIEETSNVVDCSCPPTKHLTGTICGGTYSTTTSITSDGLVEAGSDVTFQSDMIELQSEFEVESNAVFCAEIVPCTPLADTNVQQLTNTDENSTTNFKNNVKLEATIESTNLQIEQQAANQTIQIQLSIDGIAFINLQIVDNHQNVIAKLIEKEHRPKGNYIWEVDTNTFKKGFYTVQASINNSKNINKKIEIE